MKRLILALLALAIALPGCGKQLKDMDAEEAEDSAQADTASLDSGDASVESLPAVDESAQAPAPTAQTTAKNDAPMTDAVSDFSAATPPSSEPSAPPPSASGTGEMANYRVKKGDTLMKIAFNLYGDISQWKNLFELNKAALASANQLAAGMKLQYDKPASEPTSEKNGEPYLIKKGDTLGTIADDVYGKKNKWKKIYENNRTLIHDPNKIYAGFYLYYQITEEERHQAEEIKAKRGGMPLGSSEQINDSASAAKPTSMGSPGAGGGLNSLVTPPQAQGGRTPASH